MSATALSEATLGSAWRAATDSQIDDQLLGWPPDVFLLTEIMLERSEAHRFALSPPIGLSWPPDHVPDWATAVADAGRRLDDPNSAIASAVIFNALIIAALIPLSLKGVRYRPIGASALLRRNLWIYGLGGIVTPFVGIKLIDLVIHNPLGA
jgi:hypothetical protein